MTRALKFFSSLRLTVVLLGLGILLVFFGTLAQVHEGTWNAQQIYFQSAVVWWQPTELDWGLRTAEKIPIVLVPLRYVANALLHGLGELIEGIGKVARLFGPNVRLPVFPGGYLIGTVLLVNLVLAHFKGANWGQRNVAQVLAHHVPLLALVFVATWVAVPSPFVGMGLFIALLALDIWISRAGPLKNTYTGKKIGINFTHIGVVMLLLGQLATDQLATESHLTFREGDTRSWSEKHRESELVFIKDVSANQEQVVAVPESLLAHRGELRNEKLPFVVRVKDYAVNGNIRERAPMMDTNPPAATQGVGSKAIAEPLPEVNDEKRRNLPYAVIELLQDNTSLGTWLVGLVLDAQKVNFGNDTWRIALRSERIYRDFTLTLLDFTHDVYPGTEKPRDFRARVRLEDPKTRENREVDIFMNNPLRYGGETFYQSSFNPRDPRETTLQVVRNPSWLTPYFGCGAVGYGLARHFLFYLIGFIVKRRSA